MLAGVRVLLYPPGSAVLFAAEEFFGCDRPFAGLGIKATG